MRIAALDLGSNSFHLIVVETRLDGSFAPLAREKEMLRLGDVVARTGSIGEAACTEAIAVIKRYRAIAEANHADELFAKGTAAIREALDGATFVDRVRDETGVDIEVVDGVEEAQLIFTAVRSSVLIEPAPALVADLGGGSLEVMVGDQRELMYAASARLGVGRLTTELVRDDPPSRADFKRLEARIAREMAGVIDEVAVFSPKSLIGSSGTFACLARMAAARRDGLLPDSLNQLRVSADDLGAISAEIVRLPAAERAKLPGCDPKRAELLPAGIAVLTYLMDSTGLGDLTISEWALREGIVISAIGAHDRAELGDDPREIRRSSVLSLCRRCNWRQPHARQVSALALSIFDQTVDLHGLGAVERELLEYGAFTHDIGEHVSRNDHDRHTAYLIENGGLRGFAPEEIRVLGLLGRFHIRGTPRPSNDNFAALDEAGRASVLGGVAILRLADALDATHAAVVDHVTVSGKGERRRFVLHARGDAELEVWTFRRKMELFERTFSVSCDLEVQRHGRDDYEVAETAVAGLG